MNLSLADRPADASGPRSPALASAGPSWEALVEPGRVFPSPAAVVASPDLSREEKRAILASWASDAWAVESAPALRHCPGLVGHTVPLDDVLAALRALDPEEDGWRNAASDPSRAAKAVGLGRIRWLTSRRRASAN